MKGPSEDEGRVWLAGDKKAEELKEKLPRANAKEKAIADASRRRGVRGRG